MSWEPFDEWPGESRDGGAFRGRSEPVLGERRSPTPLERLRLFWHSRPDLPSAQAARRIVLTPSTVYVERFDGVRRRVARNQLRGVRRARGRVILGVLDGDDLVLPHRSSCEAQKLLVEQSAGNLGDAQWTTSSGMGASIVFGLLAFLIGVGLMFEYRFDEVRDRWEDGLYTAEVVLGHGAGWAVVAFGLFILLWGPSRYRIDPLGIERVRGIVPWLPHFRPAEEVQQIWVLPVRIRNQQGARELVGYSVKLRFHRRARFGSFFPMQMLQLAVLRGPSHRAWAEANATAERMGRMLGSEVIARK